MQVLTFPVVLFFTLLFAVLLGLAAQRLLGIRLGFVRLVITGIFAMSMFPLIMSTLVPLPAHTDPREVAPETGWFVLLAAAVTILASMAFIVVVEAFVPMGSLPPATVWGRGLKARFRRARRYWQIVGLAIRHGLGPFLRGRRARALDVPGSRQQLGRALRSTLNAGGVTFVKMGQILSTRPDVLPQEITTELARLQDDADPVPWADVEEVLVAELGAPVAEVFAEFDREPLAAASVGQVHAARLRDGTEVVVKVQRPGIRPVVERDLDIAARLGSRLESGTTWGRGLGIGGLTDALGTAIREELDYRVEAENILTVARSQPADSRIRLPMPHPDVSTERVLVMDRLRGAPIYTAGPLIDHLGLDRDELATAVLDALLRQIVVDGVFHADPHGGNIFVLDDGSLGLIDFGSVGRLDAVVRAALERLLLGVDRGDPLAVTDALLELVPRPDEIDEQSLERDIGRFMARYTTGSAASGVRMFGDLFRIVADHGLAVPGEVAAVFRCLGTAEGTLRQLAPGFDLVTRTRKLAGSYLSERLGPDQLRQAAADELVTLLPILRRLPRRVERIATAAEHGRLSLNVRLFADERDRSWLTGMLQDVLVVFLAATIGIMAVMLLGTDGGPAVTDDVSLYALLGYNLLVVSAILALRILVQIFRRSP